MSFLEKRHASLERAGGLSDQQFNVSIGREWLLRNNCLDIVGTDRWRQCNHSSRRLRPRVHATRLRQLTEISKIQSYLGLELHRSRTLREQHKDFVVAERQGSRSTRHPNDEGSPQVNLLYLFFLVSFRLIVRFSSLDFTPDRK